MVDRRFHDRSIHAQLATTCQLAVDGQRHDALVESLQCLRLNKMSPTA
jgi:hypothetical protein